MKKALAITMVIVLVGAFSIPKAFAATNAQLKPVQYKSTSVSVNSVNIDAYVTQFSPVVDVDAYGTSELNTSILALNVVFSNLSSTYKYVAYTNIKIMMTTNRSPSNLYYNLPFNEIVNIENFSNDLYVVTENSNSYLEIRPDGDWSFRNGFVVPPNTRLNCVANIYIHTETSQNNVVTSNDLYSISFAYNPSVEDTQFIPHGDNTDLEIQLDSIRQSMLAANVNLSDIITYLASIQTILQANSTTNDNITNDSNSLKNTSDNVHSQEQAYFTQNSQAIQATGLGNYQFGTVEGNGIGAVSTDFTSIWNALNGWTSVYIFSLTLGVALTILRHAPNSISRRIRSKKE